MTPSGLVDGGDDSSDFAIADIDIDDGQLEEIEVPPAEVEDIADTAAEVGDVEDIEEIRFVEDPQTVLEVEDVEVEDSEIENIEFFTDLEETAEGENGSNFDDLVNSNGALLTGENAKELEAIAKYADRTPIYKSDRPSIISGPDTSGNPARDIDFTNPTFPRSGRMRPGNPGPPHQHRFYINDPKIAIGSGFVRDAAEALEQLD